VPRQIQERSQYVDLFPNWDAGMKKVIRRFAKKREPGISPAARWLVQSD